MPKPTKPDTARALQSIAATRRLAAELLERSERLHESVDNVHRRAVEFPRETRERRPGRNGGGAKAERIVVMGASAGGIEALREVLRDLFPGFPAAVFVVLHTGSGTPGALANVLGRSTSLPVWEAEDGAAIVPGRVYVAKPDHHVSLQRGRMVVNRGPRENRQRPSIDVLFRSAAQVYDGQVIAVLLSGLLDDGTAGVQAVKARGGTVLIQKPEDALFPSMPLNALQFVNPDSLSRAADMGALLRHLTDGHMSQTQKKSASELADATEPRERPVPGPLKRPMVLSCPDCNGVLQEFGEGKLLRFRCQVGHQFSADGLVEAQNDEVERALWTAMRALEESSAVAQRMAEYSRKSGRRRSAERYEEQAREKQKNVEVLRKLIFTRSAVPAPNVGNGKRQAAVAAGQQTKKPVAAANKRRVGANKGAERN